MDDCGNKELIIWKPKSSKQAIKHRGSISIDDWCHFEQGCHKLTDSRHENITIRIIGNDTERESHEKTILIDVMAEEKVKKLLNHGNYVPAIEDRREKLTTE